MHTTVDEICELFDQLAATSGRKAKQALIEALDEDATEMLKQLLKYTYDPFILFGRASSVSVDDLPSGTHTMLLHKLTTMVYKVQQVKGEEKIRFLRLELSSYSETVQRWMARMFAKDLKIGVNVGTIHRLFPGLIRKFNTQLCEKYDGSEEDFIVEPKFDGFRAIAFVPCDGEPFILSRGGKQLQNCDHILKALQRAMHVQSTGITGITGEGLVFDGEMLKENWNTTASVVRATESDRDVTGLKYHIFDMLTMEEWRWLDKNPSFRSMKLVDRANRLGGILPEENDLWELVTVKCMRMGRIAHDSQTVYDLAMEYLASGYEGAVVKVSDSTYRKKRTKDWMKVKFEETIDGVVVGFEEGTGRNVGRLGAMVVVLENGKKVNVGNGYTDVERENFWQKRSELMGKVIEFKQQKATGTIDAVARFPVFMKVRVDR